MVSLARRRSPRSFSNASRSWWHSNASYLHFSFVHQMNGRETDDSGVAKLEALHVQCRQQARLEAKFARKPGNWGDVQRRVS